MKSAEEIAREIWDKQLSDLCDRGGIKRGFSDIEPHIWEEIHAAHIAIIAQALREQRKWPEESEIRFQVTQCGDYKMIVEADEVGGLRVKKMERFR